MKVMNISKNFERLKVLELDNEYVFHGSGISITELEPRQAYSWVDGLKEADGLPAVYASDRIDYAIFMALFNQHNCKRSATSSCSFQFGELIFGASAETLEQLSDTSVGYVHVLSRRDFELRGGCEWRCEKRISPIEVIQVNRSDFTPTINLIEHITSN